MTDNRQQTMQHNFRELNVWARAIEFVTEIYSLTRAFPKDELFGLTSQLRRAASSIALNIAEGSGGSSNAEFVRFLEIARRSAYEVMTGLEVAQRLAYSKREPVMELLSEADQIAAMITGLMRRLRTTK